MHTKILLLLLATLLPTSLFAQYQDLWISNPNNSWNRTPIDVHETVFEVHPKGTFAEVELFISFSSSDPSYFQSSELLEMVSTFELDENISVSDLWLWFDKQILVAHIIDRWTANRVYEGIVNRQEDPAILYKNSPTSYELRVYPFTREQVRKIKISFLVPIHQQNATRAIALPTKFNQLAQNNLEDAVIRYFTEEENPELYLSEDEDISFISASDSLDRTYWQAEVSKNIVNGSLNLEIPTLSEESSSLVHYEDSTGKYYSLSFVPNEILDVSTDKKVVIVFDYVASNSNASKSELLQRIQQNIKTNFSDSDQFNFLYSTVSNEVLSENWIRATDAAVDSLFEEIDSSDILGVSNLDDLLVTGIDYITEKNGKGNILLISGSDTYHKFSDANSFSESILNYAGDDLPQINIVDVQDENEMWQYRNGRDYRGNEYLYDIFARESGGKLFNFKDHYNVDDLIRLGHQNLDGNISNYTVYTTFDGGFSYGNFNNQTSDKIPVNSTFTQTGMYFGNPPITIQFSGTTRDTVFSEEIVINNATATDSSLKRFWTGRQINTLEKGNPDNEEITTIIDYSIENRLMSQYTSFLSIEPGDTTLINEAQDEDGNSVSTDDETPDSFEIESLKAYPNPFNPQVNIEVNLSEPWNASNSRIVIYNILGQKVATLNTSKFNGQRSFTVNWDISKSSAKLATGVYFVSVETPIMNKKIKITYLK